MKIFNDNKEVIGKVDQNENSWRASWLVPKGYYREGSFLFVGEYNSFNEAQYKLHEFLDKRDKEIKESKIEREIMLKKFESEDRNFKFTAIIILVVGVLFILSIMCKN